MTFANSLAPLPVTAGAKTAVSGATISGVGALSAEQLATPQEFSVALGMRNLAEFQARVAQGELVPYEEVQAKYLPLQADYDRLLAWLMSEGFTPTYSDSSRLSIFVQGTAAQIQRSFALTMRNVTVEGVAYPAAVTAPSLPASVSGGVLGVNGLQPYLQVQPHHVAAKLRKATTASTATITAATTGDQPSASVSASTPPFHIGDVLNAYSGLPLTTTTADGTTTTLDGSGQKIAVIINAFALHSDLTTFWTNNGIAQVIGNIEEVNVAGGSTTTRQQEETLDEEWSSGIAPGAKVRVYCSNNLNIVNLDKCLAQIQTDVTGSTASSIAQPQLHALSMSYGGNQSGFPASEYQTEASYYVTIANGNTFYGGVSIFASTGDYGSQPSGSSLYVEYPAADLSITGVGGTNLYYAAGGTPRPYTETGWSGSGGGAATSAIARPAWQTGTGVPSGSTRLLPDVAAVASNYTYADFEYNGQDTGIAGTSWSAPTWAGFAALFNQARILQGRLPLGFLNARLYPLIGTSYFYDITSGNNSTNGTGSYSCTAGYDEVTGVGTPNLGALVGILGGPTITSFSPNNAAPGSSVTITGTGFGPVTKVAFGGVAATSYAVNSGGTQIVATVPAGTPASGSITAATAFGDVATSLSAFVQQPDASVGVSHGGTISQDDVGDVFTVNVANVGAAAVSGLVKVTLTPPTGATIAQVTGNGWICQATNGGNSQPWLCTRNDTLAAGASYPALTCLVNVGPDITTTGAVAFVADVASTGDYSAANNDAGDRFTVNAVASTPTQEWRYQYFGTTANSGSAADAANPVGDGISNLLKYAYNLDPTKWELNPVTNDVSTGYLRLTAPKNPVATDLTYTVQVTSDLTNPGSWTSNDTTVLVNTSQKLQVRDNTPVGGTAKRFMRLHISR